MATFFAFDALKIEGRDVRQLPLIERKRRLKRIMPKVESRLRHVQHIDGTGEEFYRLACAEDLEGIVAKWKFGNYSSDPQRTSCLKIKNPTYSQAEGRGELFEQRRHPRLRVSDRPYAGFNDVSWRVWRLDCHILI